MKKNIIKLISIGLVFSAQVHAEEVDLFDYCKQMAKGFAILEVKTQLNSKDDLNTCRQYIAELGELRKQFIVIEEFDSLIDEEEAEEAIVEEDYVTVDDAILLIQNEINSLKSKIDKDISKQLEKIKSEQQPIITNIEQNPNVSPVEEQKQRTVAIQQPKSFEMVTFVGQLRQGGEDKYIIQVDGNLIQLTEQEMYKGFAFTKQGDNYYLGDIKVADNLETLESN